MAWTEVAAQETEGHMSSLPGGQGGAGPGGMEGPSKRRSKPFTGPQCQSVFRGSWPWYEVSPLEGRRRPSQAWGAGPVVWGVDVSFKSVSATRGSGFN